MINSKEIGSEFWAVETLNNHELFFLSGRTALDFIIRDILAEHKITLAHIPSFCCHTMLEPFYKNQIPVRFYDVFFENNTLQADIPQTNKNEIFFYIKYFGYNQQDMGNMAAIKESGSIIIEDITHSWLVTDTNNCEKFMPNYSFTSYRKWTGFTGIASAKKHISKFTIPQNASINEEYEALKKESQEKKYTYLQFGKGDKQEFLNGFSNAEDILDTDYVDYIPSFKSLSDFISLDKNYIINKRRENAKILLDGISGLNHIVPMFQDLSADDTPLCVPILVPADIRNELRKYLISQQIYCPVHWPLSSLHATISERSKLIYNSQLSLICDQRYDTHDMERIVNCIQNFFAK